MEKAKFNLKASLIIGQVIFLELVLEYCKAGNFHGAKSSPNGKKSTFREFLFSRIHPVDFFHSLSKKIVTKHYL